MWEWGFFTRPPQYGSNAHELVALSELYQELLVSGQDNVGSSNYPGSALTLFDLRGNLLFGPHGGYREFPGWGVGTLNGYSEFPSWGVGTSNGPEPKCPIPKRSSERWHSDFATCLFISPLVGE